MLLSGLHAASWGAYKYTPHEGFRIASYVRSVLLAGVVALILSVCTPGLGAGVVLVGVVYAIERLATEGWKAILREQDQARYTILMRLAFRGCPVDRKDIRYAVGGLFAAGAGAALTGVDALQARLPAAPGTADCASGRLDRRLGYRDRGCMERRTHRGLQWVEVSAQSDSGSRVGRATLFPHRYMGDAAVGVKRVRSSQR